MTAPGAVELGGEQVQHPADPGLAGDQATAVEAGQGGEVAQHLQLPGCERVVVAVLASAVEPGSALAQDAQICFDAADKVTDGGLAEKILANAPGGAVYIDPTDRNAGGFFTVPKVVE